jgi:hypothetical protein
MRRLLARLNSTIWSLWRFDAQAMRRIPAVLLLIAAGLTAWVFELGAVLQGQAQVRNWSSTWVGLDLMEITGLVLTAILLRRRSVYLSAVAAVTATLFTLDAWFDVLTASAGTDWYESLAVALLGEVPMSLLLAALAVWAPLRCGRHDAANRPGPHPTAGAGPDRAPLTASRRPSSGPAAPRPRSGDLATARGTAGGDGKHQVADPTSGNRSASAGTGSSSR